MLATLGRVLVCTAPLAIVSYGLWRALQGFADNGVFTLLVSVLVAVGLGGLAYLGAAKLLEGRGAGIRAAPAAPPARAVPAAARPGTRGLA